jgi:hypothetical protein
VVAVEGQEYWVYMYVHNNAANWLNLTATGVRVQIISLDTSANTTQQMRGFIDADNIGAKQDGSGGHTVGTFWDECGFQSMDDRKFTMRYVIGSAIYHNNAGEFKLPDTVVTGNGENPVLIGDTALNGRISGCAEHAGFVIIRVVPKYEQEDESPEMNTTLIKKHENNSWGQMLNITISEGSLIDVKVVFTNASAKNVENVSFRANLGDGLSYINGSLRFTGSNESGNIANLNPIAGDVIIGSYKPGETATLEYQITTNNDIDTAVIEVNNMVSFNDLSGNTQTNTSRAFISKASTSAPIGLPETKLPVSERIIIIASILSGVGGLIALVRVIGAFLKKRKKRKVMVTKSHGNK